jgi:ABC-type glycerol-3-phosphate transport system substrate-binding protein
MKNKFKIVLACCFLGTMLVLSGGCVKKTVPRYEVSLEVWGPFDDSRLIEDMISKYRLDNPFLGDVVYRRIPYESYKKDLLDALATGKGPDVFFISNNWVGSFGDKIEAAPVDIFGEQEFRNNFVDVVVDDFLVNGKVQGSPLSVDSLGLYYNKDLFNAAGITAPPITWEDFKNQVSKLTRIDEVGNIVQAGAAIGTAYNINRSTDLLSLIMMQKGTRMTDKKQSSVLFSTVYNVDGQSTRPGEVALQFYTDFSSSASPVYTWNPRMHYSIDAFTEGSAAMMFNYSWRVAEIQKKNPKLNFAVARIPQFPDGKELNYPNYYGMVVSRNKTYEADDPRRVKKTEGVISENELRVREAWQLVRYLTANNNGSVRMTNWISKDFRDFPVENDPAEVYLKSTGRPAARRDILEKQKSDPFLGPFALGNLIAKNWYQSDPEAIETILAEMIDSVNKGNATLKEGLTAAASRVSQLFR